jgi:hypothetical protein
MQTPAPYERLLERNRTAQAQRTSAEDAKRQADTSARQGIAEQIKTGGLESLRQPAAPAAITPAAPSLVNASSGPLQRGGKRNPKPAAPITAAPALAAPSAQSMANAVSAGPPASLAPRPGDPNTFTGANGVVRSVNADGSVTGAGSRAGSLQVMQGTTPAAAGTPAPTAGEIAARAGAPTAPALGGASPASSGGGFTAGPNSFMVQETLRRFDNANSRFGKMTKTAREGRNALLLAMVGGEVQGRNQQAALASQGQNALAAAAQQGATQVQDNRERSQAALQAAQIGADAQITAATTPRPMAPQLYTGADGTAQVFTGAPQLQPLMTADGTPFTPQQAPQQADPRVQAAQIRAQSDLLQSLIPIGATPEEVQQAQQQVLSMMQSAAGGGVPQIPPGTERNGFRFKGGDPSNSANWEKM